MRLRIAVGFALAFVVSLLAVSPADAAVTTIVKGNGDVVINGDAAPNNVRVTLCGGYAQVRVDFGEHMEPVPVVDDLFINLKGGSDDLRVQTGQFELGDEPERLAEANGEGIPVECSGRLDLQANRDHEHEHEPHIPGNLRITTASGGDRVDVTGRRSIDGLSIGKDLILNMSNGQNDADLNYIYVGDDVSIRASGGDDEVELYNYWINDRLDINLGGGTNETYLGSGENGGDDDGDGIPVSGAGRTTVRGSGGFDRVSTGGGGGNGAIDLGHNPQITTGGNEDNINMGLVGWTGRFRVNTGSGDDFVLLRDCCLNNNGLAQVQDDHELDRGRLDVNTSSGDDTVIMQAESIAADRFNGDPGNGDCIFHDEEGSPATTIVNFEFINDLDCPTSVV